MWVRLETGNQGRIDIYYRTYAGRSLYDWEWYSEGRRNTGGNWQWNFEPAMGGSRYVIKLYENRPEQPLARLTHGRIAFRNQGAEPPQPWFTISDSGNGTFPSYQPTRAQPLYSAFTWSVSTLN